MHDARSPGEIGLALRPLGSGGRYLPRRYLVRSLNAVVMVAFIRLAVGYVYMHLIAAKLTAMVDQLLRMLDGW